MIIIGRDLEIRVLLVIQPVAEVLQNSAYHNGVVHELLLVHTRRRDLLPQDDRVEEGGDLLRVLPLAVGVVARLLVDGRPQVVEVPQQEADAGGTHADVHQHQEDAENLVQCHGRPVHLVVLDLEGFAQDRLDVLQHLGGKALADELDGAAFVALGVEFFHVVSQTLQGGRMRFKILLLELLGFAGGGHRHRRRRGEGLVLLLLLRLLLLL